MLEFMNYIGSALTFVIFLITIYLNKTSKEKSYFLMIITGLMFLYTLVGMPITSQSKAQKNIATYEKGISLSCASGFLFIGSTFTVDKDRWELEGNYFTNKQINEKIRADKCD